METLVAAILVLLAASARLLPHPANFAPVAAVALFAGAVLPRRFALVVPVAAMLLSDALLGFYALPVMASVYGCFLAVTLLGIWSRRQEARAASTVGAALAGSVLFFLVTNAAVWAWGGMYPATVAGLFRSYAMAVPFFRNTLAGDLFYDAMLFGAYGLAVFLVRHGAWFRDRRMLRSPHA